MKSPNVLAHTGESDLHRFDLEVSESLDWFEGHFPGFPILPGVVQLRWAVELAQQHLGFTDGPHEVKRLKFKSVIVPPLEVQLSLCRLGDREVDFAYTGDGHDYSQGRLLFDGTGQ